MKPTIVLALFTMAAGCGGLFELRVPARVTTGPAARPAAAAQPAAAAPAAAAPDPAAREEARRLQVEEQGRRRQAAEEEAARRKQAEEAARKEAEAKAQIPQKLKVAELGIEVTVPGDVAYKPHHSTAYGDPALFLAGPVSQFSLILTNAETDRYDLEDRIRKQRGSYTYGIDVVRRKQRGGGSWEFEFTAPTYFTDGKRAWDEMGVFARRVVAGKKYNCLIAGLTTQKALDEAVKACLSIKPAR